MAEKVDSAALKLNRLKQASAAYQEYKSIQTEYEATGLDPETGIDEGAHMAEGTQTWPEFREAFLADWNNNRRIVDEKEADVHFDTLADQALNELDSGALPVDVATIADEVPAETDTDETIGVIVADPTTSEPVGVTVTMGDVPAVKRRGRPPGSGKAKIAKAPKAAKRGRPAGAKLKKVAAKKKGGNKSAQAQTIIERYAARDWSRKDIIGKLVAQIDVGQAYAATLYQKFA